MKKDIREAYAEIDVILQYIPIEYKNRVPIKLQDMFKNKKSLEYKVNIDKSDPINKQKLKRETIVILAILQYNFWCETNEEKSELKRIFKENEDTYQTKLQGKYSIDDMFKNKKGDLINLENIDLPLTVNNKSFRQKIIDSIKRIFKKIIVKY